MCVMFLTVFFLCHDLLQGYQVELGRENCSLTSQGGKGDIVVAQLPGSFKVHLLITMISGNLKGTLW